MSSVISSALTNWIPYKLSFKEDQPQCEWLYTNGENFVEPFFDETISKLRQYNNRGRKSISIVDMLPDWSAQVESIQPSAFIFHVSRCGSTLATQLLSLNDNNIVLSEVPFFDALLRSGKNDLLKDAIALYASPKNNRDRLFIKTDSWHIFFYKQIRELYPQAPFIFLYRQPDEVIRSQQKKRGMHAVPGVIESSLFGFHANEIVNISLDEYMGKVLEKYFSAFLKIMEEDKLAVFINYKDGAVSMMEKIAKASGIQLSSVDIERIKERSKFHAKYPGQAFEKEKTDEAVPAYCKTAYKLYETLEERRMNS